MNPFMIAWGILFLSRYRTVVCLVNCFLILVDEQFVISGDDSSAIMEGIERGEGRRFLAAACNVNGETILVRFLLEFSCVFTRLAV